MRAPDIALPLLPLPETRTVNDGSSRAPLRSPDAATLAAVREYMDARRLFAAAPPPPSLLDKLKKDRKPAFRDTLLSMIRDRGLVDSRVYEAAGIDRRHYSKIRKDPNWRPTKTTVVSFALALRLCLADADRLLRSAGYAFSDAQDFDLICSYFIEHRNWNANDVNDVLHAFRQPLVCGALS